MNSESGFTLVEVVVAGVLSTVLGGAVLTSLYMTNTQTLLGTASQRLTQYHSVASDQICRMAKSASVVKKSGENAVTVASIVGDPLISGLSEIVLCGAAGDTLAGYRIHLSPGYLEEWKGPGLGYGPFRIGTDSVSLDPASSQFGILPRRRGVTFTLLLTRLESGTTYGFPGIQETVICRNNNR